MHEIRTQGNSDKNKIRRRVELINHKKALSRKTFKQEMIQSDLYKLKTYEHIHIKNNTI